MDGAGKSQASTRTTRPYRSSGRQDQARRTRHQILASARREFLSAGYAGTTVPAIAARARVAVATVEKAFGPKAQLLKAVIDVAIAGDDEPDDVLARATAAGADTATTTDEFLKLVADILTAGQQRSARLVLVEAEAAASDPELGLLAQQRMDQRHTVARWIVDGVSERAPLRVSSTRAYAADVVWALMEPTLYCRLTGDRHWSPEQYRRWFIDSTTHLLLDPTRDR